MIILAVLVALAALVWLAVALAGRAGSGPQGGGFGGRGRPATTVGVAIAAQADVPISLDALGTVTPAATVTVSPRVSGVITEILFREGQTVRKGDALAVIDPRPLRMALMQAQGALMRDEAQLANARLLLQRQRTLLAQDSIARQEVDTQAALVRQLEGAVTVDRASVGTARLNLGFSRVTAPVSGRVGLRVVDVGNFIAAGAAEGVAVITEVAPIDVEFAVPQDEVARIQAEAGRGRLPVTAFDRTRTVTLEQGVFSTLDNQVDTTTGTVRAKARFANGGGRLFPNQFVNVRLNLQTVRGAVVVPVAAIRTAADGDFVWILNADRTVSRRRISRGPGTPDITAVTAGLRAGERVITEGGDRLTDGARVTLPGDRPQNRRRNRRGHGDGGAPNGEGPAPARAEAEAPQPATKQAGPPDGGRQVQGARQALMQACAADVGGVCGGRDGRELFICLRENRDRLGGPCKEAMARMPRRRPPGGAQEGGAD